MTDDRVEAVRLALEVALRDFQDPTPVHLRLEVGTSSGDDLIWVDRPDGSRTGFWVDGDATGEELLVQVAYFLQDQVFDQLQETWGEARPPCPGHPHPADPRLREGEAWWACPRTDDPLGRIGRIGRT